MESLKDILAQRIAAHFEHSIQQHSSLWAGSVYRYLLFGPEDKIEYTPTPNDLLEQFGIDYAQLCIVSYFWKRLHELFYEHQPELVERMIIELVHAVPTQVEHSVCYHRYLVELMRMIKPFTAGINTHYVEDCIQFHLNAIESKPGFSQYAQFYGTHFEMRAVGCSVDPTSINIILGSAKTIIANGLKDYFPLSELNRHAVVYLFQFTVKTWCRIGENENLGIGAGPFEAYGASDSEAPESCPVAEAASIVREITGTAKTTQG